MASVTLKNITKSWGDFTAVNDISLSIHDQEFLVLLGPSGCGKTTTMRMVAGLEEPSKGDIFIGSKRVNDELPKDRDVAMVFQNYGLYPHMSVYENIRYPLKVRKVPKSEHEDLVKKTAVKVELGNLLNRRPRELSGGQRQRLSIARALVKDAPILILDEATSALDSESEIEVQQAIEHLMENRTTVVIAHRLSTIRSADRICVMENGQIVEQGNHDDLLLNGGRYQQLYEMQFKNQPEEQISEDSKERLVS